MKFCLDFVAYMGHTMLESIRMFNMLITDMVGDEL